MNLSEMRARLRRDLHDEAPGQQRWTDAELDRHLQRAVRETSLAIPREAVAELTAPGGRQLDISPLADLVRVEAVEYPVGLFPPSLVPFSLWGSSLTILGDVFPRPGEQVRIYYGALHRLEEAHSTLPQALEELVLLGAAAYAALEWAGYAADRINVGGEEVWQRFLTWGREMLSQFRQGLQAQSRRSPRTRRLQGGAP